MRILVDGLLKDTASIASPGVDSIRWIRPVRPGDVLSARLTTVEAMLSRSSRERGTLRQVGELRNQDGELVMTVRLISIIGRRPAAEAGDAPGAL